MREAISVTALNEYIKARLDTDAHLQNISVRGEISNFKLYSSGHAYFTLKDDAGQLKSVIFRSYFSRLAFLPEDGKIRMPFNSLPGLGDGAAEKIIAAREKYHLYSIEELRLRTGISKTVIEILRRNHVLDKLSETNQFSMF